MLQCTRNSTNSSARATATTYIHELQLLRKELFCCVNKDQRVGNTAVDYTQNFQMFQTLYIIMGAGWRGSGITRVIFLQLFGTDSCRQWRIQDFSYGRGRLLLNLGQKPIIWQDPRFFSLPRYISSLQVAPSVVAHQLQNESNILFTPKSHCCVLEAFWFFFYDTPYTWNQINTKMAPHSIVSQNLKPCF